MEPRTLQYLARACAGDLRAGPAEALVDRVCIDSRQVGKGDLFVALRGAHFDGHSFLAQAGEKGAVAAVVDRSVPRDPRGPAGLIAVDDTLAALGRLGACYRREFSVVVVAVGGSNGKSTTKELIASILRRRGLTLWSEASFNNAIGVPLTLLKLERAHETAVFEVGTNHPGELAPLVAMVQPRFGVITSIGREHLEFFGDLDGVRQEEGRLAEMLPPDGRLFLNTADDAARSLPARSRAPVVRVGWEPGNDWWASRLAPDERGVTFQLSAPQREFCGEYRVNLLGRHQVLNGLLAAAVGAELGLSPDQVRQGLAACAPLKRRLQLWETAGIRVLDDSYNANADSMLAALQTLKELPCSGRRVAVLGDMAELGSQGAAAHGEVGRQAAVCGISQLFTVGPMARLTAESARQGGLSEVHELADAAEAVREVLSRVRGGDLVLLKASRVVGLEQVSDALKRMANG